MRYLLLSFFLLLWQNSFAQLGFCKGSKGDPIFHEDFGTGTSTGPPLAPGITNYIYVTGDPHDGEYTISDKLGQEIGSWHSSFPRTTISNGRALKVNADDQTSGRFYRTQVSGLCEHTSYEFSAFLINVYDPASNVCENRGIPVNVRFEIWDQTDTQMLAEGSTGDIQATTTPQWKQFALTFQSAPGQGSVILKMYNNGIGGCGNDLAIDDIIFRSCGDLTTITSGSGTGNTLNVCESDTPVSVDLTATPDFSVYSQHAFQWQESTNNQDWTDIPGAISSTFTSPPLSASRFYRVKVAEDQVNLSNNLCSSASEAYHINILQKPAAPQSNGDITICEGEAIPALSVRVQSDESVFWFDSASGGNLLASESNNFIPTTPGTYYAEARKTGFTCEPGPRTAVKFVVNEIPVVEDENLIICPQGQLELDAGPGNMTYEWSTGQTTQKIIITQAGNYFVKVSHPNGCAVTKEVVVESAAEARIDRISSEGMTVSIFPADSEKFEYSLDGVNFQPSNIFLNISGGIYFAYVRDLAGCKTVQQPFPHIVVPQFISPNNDGQNDVFRLKGVEFFESSGIKIFDRYGKILFAGKGEGFSWDGTLNGRDLPADDYWYEINIPGFMFLKGHFSLIR